MRNTTSYGTPCLVSVTILSTDGTSARGFITRLSTHSAAVSSAPVLPKGSRVTLTFRRPSDNENHEVVGDVVELMEGGGLWRGRPAALVKFDDLVDVDDLSVPRSLREMRVVKVPTDLVAPPERSSEAGRPPGLSSGLRAGLGRRRVRLGPGRRATSPPSPTHDRRPPTESFPPGAIQPLGYELDDPSTWQDAPGKAPFTDSDDTAPPQNARLADDSLSFDSSAQFREDPFRVSRAVDLDDDTAPPVGELTEDPFPGPAPAPVGPPRHQDVPPPLPARDDFVDPLGSIDKWTEADQVRSRPSAPQMAPPQEEAMRFVETTVAPWEDDAPAASLIPRGARIASSLQVTYWARGRKSLSMARNFSKRGLFLSTAGAPPVRGAVVRVEFPIEGSEETASVKFNAEVRWHSADRPQDGLPDGFGVRIMGFEQPTSRMIYEEFLALILHLDEQSRSQEMQFEWGKPGGLR